jgi:hypothetical protein
VLHRFFAATRGDIWGRLWILLMILSGTVGAAFSLFRLGGGQQTHRLTVQLRKDEAPGIGKL